MAKDYKLEAAKVNISSSFLTRTKCIECNEPPSEYYWVGQAPNYQDPKNNRQIFDWLRKYIRSITSSWYLKHQPRHFRSIKDFNVFWKASYKPTVHQHRGIGTYDNSVEFLACPCGRTVWAFNQKSVVNRPEIKNRKGRYSYPKKFEALW